MGGKAYVGIDNTSRNIKKCYVGVDGVARKIKKAYVGVNGIARLCYISEITNSILPCNSTTATGSILHAMGIFHGTAHTDWDSLVTAVLGHLGSLGYVTADGKIKLSVLGAGVTMIPGAIISAVKSFLFSSGALSSGLDDSKPLASSGSVVYSTSSSGYIPVPNYFPYLSGWRNINQVTGKKYSYKDWGLTSTFLLFWSDSSSYPYHVLEVNANTFSLTYSDSSITVSAGYGAIRGGYDYKSGSFSGFSLSATTSYSISGNPQIFCNAGVGTAVTSSSDYNLTGAQSLNDDDTPDVIYPGWATHSENVDTNIDVVADAGTGAIDGVITADKYYPIGIPDLGTSIYDQTQAGAQTGTNAVLLI